MSPHGYMKPKDVFLRTRHLKGVSAIFRTVEIPAFRNGTSPWTDYEAFKAEGIKSFTVTPRIYLKIFGFDPTDQPLVLPMVECHFDAERFPAAIYGILYCDEEFEARFNDHVREKIFPGLGVNVKYTESGMQGEDYISLEFQRPYSVASLALADLLGSLSAHDRMDYVLHPELMQVTRDSETLWSRP